MNITVRMPADRGTRFAPGAFDGIIGKRYPMVLDSVPGTLVGAEVVDEGSAVLLTLEFDDTVQLASIGGTFGLWNPAHPAQAEPEDGS